MIKKAFHFVNLIVLLTAPSLIAAPTKTEPKTPIVFVEELKATEVFDLLSYPARLIPSVNASLLSDVDGVVQKIVTPLGRRVSRGQRVMILKSTDPVYDYAPLAVTAQVSGIVSGIEVTEGSRVAKGQKLAQITDPTKIKITIEVSVADLNAIHAGLTGDLSVAGVEDRVKVKVLGVSPVVDPATGSATAELALVDQKQSAVLPPGAVGKVLFRAREHRGIQIPENAVTYKGPDPFVKVVEEGKAKYLPVMLGETRQGLVEVLKGLAESQKIIVRTNAFVAEGETVEIQKTGPKS